MPYSFEPGQMYRMPTHFGPSLGPRQGVDGSRYANTDGPKKTIHSVRFRTTAEALDKLLPPRFELAGEPIVTVTASYITNIQWLAGRGYNTLGVTCPVVFRGEQTNTSGAFLMVLWENLTDPIITGREELGYPKIYGELPEPRHFNGTVHCSAGWLGHQFMSMTVRDQTKLDDNEMAELAMNQPGLLLYKYMPRTHDWGEPDVEYVTYTPPPELSRYLKEAWTGEGSVSFHESTWEELPTLFNIVNALASLPILETRPSITLMTVGGIDYRSQQVLE